MSDKSITDDYLKSEIDFLEKKLAEKRKQLIKDRPIETKKIIKDSISEKIQESTYLNPNSLDSKKTISVVGRISLKQLKKMSKEKQVDILIQLAFSESIIEAINWAQNLNDPFVLDSLHDALVDRFYDELLKRGKI